MDMKTQTRKLNIVWILSASLLFLAGAATVKAADENELRISTTSQGQGIQRGGVGAGKISHDELQALLTSGERSKTTRGSQQKKDMASSLQSGSVSSAVTPNVEFWFYDVDVQLYSDVDRDGYYSGIDLAFDADTVYGIADVYAVIYLSYDFGPWNEYAVTEDFTIFGASANDEYVVETDLVAGYLTGDYDILIELFDAVDGSFVADIGPDQSSELSFLPLEDIGRDTPRETTIVVNNGGGGALGLLGLLALFGLAAPRFAAAYRSA
jgi:hypothetical protein